MTSKEFKKHFSKILADRINYLGLSQSEIAKRSGLSQPTIGLLMKGRSTPSSLTIIKLADALIMKPSDLIDFASVHQDHWNAEVHNR